MLEEREVLVGMVSGLGFLEGSPLTGVKETVVVGKVDIVADQPEHLGLSSEWIIADGDGQY